MDYLSGVFLSPFGNVLFLVFLIAFLGFALGKIEIKGVGLGDAGVFLMALVFGHFAAGPDSLLQQKGIVTVSPEKMKAAMNIVQNIGLLCFVTSVGFIAGPKFFSNLKRNAKSYVLIGLSIIGSATLITAIIIMVTPINAAMGVGILSGALTTTPGFAAANDALLAFENSEALIQECTIGHAIGYPFGVVGVVLFVQIIPKLLRADLEAERQKMIASSDQTGERVLPSNLIKLDSMGLGAFSLAICLGVILGKVSVPLPGGASFALGNTGGALMMGLILGHFGRISRLSMEIMPGMLKTFREFGLIMFLIGAGVPGGDGFVKTLQEQGFILFVYGALMTTVPLILGYVFARYVVKLCMLNNLGSITGGMTSTPALGALINSAKTDDVAAAYASTYPVALVMVVLASQFLITFLQ